MRENPIITKWSELREKPFIIFTFLEHYLVRVMRGHEDFVPELDLVLELDGQVIGNIMYTKAALTDETGTKKEILTFGPVSIAP